ncbi:MAG: enoyl-CoA hydratase/isomerase family protein [Acidimicrobiia bacterium]|nr:enoyl-CoA hydratase/isomerase family protein [Acidimicrobiia bacterium]
MNGFDVAASGDVWTLTLNNGENRIGSIAISEWNRALDQVEQSGSGKALVVTGTDKYWSTGLDLDEINRSSHLEKQAFMARIDALLARLLTAPFPTVAALNGHTYAGGALVSLAFDYRIMREDRGFFCLPSVDVQIPFTAGMAALIADKIPQPIAHDLVVSGRQIGGTEAKQRGIINEAVPADRVLPRSQELAATLTGKDAQTLATVKRRMYPLAIGYLSRSI